MSENQSNMHAETATEAVLRNTYLVGLIIKKVAFQPENGQNLSTTQPLVQAAQLRQLNHTWKECAEHFLVNCLKALTIEVNFMPDYLQETELIRDDLPRRTHAYLSFHEAANAGESLADDFERIACTLQGRRRPSQVYQVISSGPLLRLKGQKQLISFVNFLNALSGGAEQAPKPMTLEALSLVILERDGSTAQAAVLYLPTIEALLEHFTQLKHLSLNFDIARYIFWHVKDSLQKWTVQYLVESRLGSPLNSLDLNFNGLFTNDGKDFSGLAPLMPQLTGHFGLNAETVPSVLPILMTEASDQLKSLKINTTGYKVKNLVDDKNDDKMLMLNPGLLQSVSSLTLINNTKCKEMEADGIKVRVLLLRHFTGLKSLVLAEQDDTWLYRLGTISIFFDETFAVLAGLHLLTRLTLIGLDLSDLEPSQDGEPLRTVRKLTVVGFGNFLRRSFFDGNRRQLDVSRLVRIAFTRQMPSLAGITFFGPLGRTPDGARRIEERFREELAPKQLRRQQLFIAPF